MAHRKTVLQYGKEYALITLSALIYALCFNWFFRPNNMAFGGVTGIAQILNQLFPVLPVGILTIVINVPLFVLGVRRIGLGILFSSFMPWRSVLFWLIS